MSGKKPYMRTLVCLANSRKMSGRCVAGRELTGKVFGDWLRPISARPLEELSEEERRYSDGRDPRVLDIISIPLSSPYARSYQTENHIIDPNYYWEKRGTISWAELQGAVERFTGPLWVDGHSSYHGENDRVPENIAATLTRSLYVIEPTSFRIVVSIEGEEFNDPKRKVRAFFEHNDVQYKLSVTDPVAEGKFLAGEDGEFALPKVILCISLGELYQHYAYKLIAAVITP